ncbi:hypothetical protein SGLAM104S_01209 [Streptomyces glaucescens]
MPASEKVLPQMRRPPKASLENRWLWASTNPRTCPRASAPVKGAPVTLICESGAGARPGSTSRPAASWGGAEATVRTRRSSS